METMFTSVAGLDVHKKTIVACVRCANQMGGVEEQVRTFGTMTRDLLRMSDWLTSRRVTHVAMESTGVLWKPIFNLLEDLFDLTLVNPVELKQVPGRKSDVKDCQWIARLLQFGLLSKSYVPARAQRQLRDLTRHRAQLVSEQSRVANRIHKTLEDANIKLGAVASDILGVSGRAMLRSLIAGEREPAKLADLARRRLRKKIPELQTALEGRFSDHHRFMVQQLMDHLEYLEKQIEQFDTRIEEAIRPFLSDRQMEQLDAIPGVNRRTIENVVAEIGSTMKQFPSEEHLSSWAGMCPGNEESAGKRKSRRMTPGNRWLRRALGESAWAAKSKKGSYFRSQYHRLAARRGKKRAVMAVGHSLLVVIYHVLKYCVDYKDLGADYFNQLEPNRLKRYLVKRLEQLGFNVTLEPAA